MGSRKGTGVDDSNAPGLGPIYHDIVTATVCLLVVINVIAWCVGVYAYLRDIGER